MKFLQRLIFISMLLILPSGLGAAGPFPRMVLAQSSDPVFVGAGDISNCSRTQDEETAKLLDNISGTVFTLGDNVYPDGTTAQFNDCYDPTWGRHKNRTRPSPGNHDYHVNGAAGYFGYFGSAAGDPSKGYYSYNLGAWHIISLNSETSQGAGSAQEQWLRADLAANQTVCTLAYWHKPRFSSGQHGNISASQALWQALYDYKADVILNGHDHTYERFAPQNPNAQADPNGIREFVVGTGGAGLYPFPTIQPNSQVRNNTTYGVLKLTLHATSYDWAFVPIAGQTFTDSGNANCVGGGTNPTPTRTQTSGPGATPTATRTSTPGPTATHTLGPGPSDTIFSDSFESGNLSAWSSSTTDGGDLSASTAATLVGNKGLQAVIDDNNSIYVTDDSPNVEPRYRARFYFDPNSIAMINGDMFFIFNGFEGTSTAVTRVDFRRYSNAYQIRGRILDDSSNWIDTNWFIISDASHFIELDWRSATASGANNGSLTFWIDGVQQASLGGVNNDTLRIDQVRLGAVSGIDSGTRGTLSFDAFESRRQSYIGPASGVSTPPPSSATPTSAPNATPTRTSTPTQTISITMHVGDLDGSSTLQNNRWTANVTITVHDANHNPVANATISGSWSNGASGTASCTTTSNGQCSVSINGISKGQNSVTFTVNNISRASSTYTSANNHDPEGDSNGTRIVVPKP
jgi:hypothetical protein